MDGYWNDFAVGHLLGPLLEPVRGVDSSMNYLGDFPPGGVVYVWFNTFSSNDPSASVTATDIVDTDIVIYKDDSLTQRANTAGVSVDIDVDTFAGVHKFRVDTADNTVADFYEAGHDYACVIVGGTVDAGSINAVVATFSLANRRVAGHMATSSIEALTDQNTFTLTTGEASADDDAYNDCIIIVTDQVTKIQKAVGYISDYTGATRSVQLYASPLQTGFTMAVADSVEIFACSAFANVHTINRTAQTAGDVIAATITNAQGADVATDVAAMIDANNRVDVGSWLGSAVTSGTGGPDVNVNAVSDDTTAASNLELFTEVLENATGLIDAGTFKAGAIDAAAIAADAIGSSELAATAVNEIVDQVWNEARGDHTTDGSTGQAMRKLLDIDVDDTTAANAGSALGQIDDIQTDTGTTLDARIPTSLVGGRIDATIDGTGMETGAVDAILQRQVTEAYNVDGTAPTVEQALMGILQGLTEFAISSTTLTVKKLDGSTTAMTFTLDDATNPTSRTRAS